jgi:hypothetical protein
MSRQAHKRSLIWRGWPELLGEFFETVIGEYIKSWSRKIKAQSAALIAAFRVRCSSIAFMFGDRQGETDAAKDKTARDVEETGRWRWHCQ